MDSPMKSKTTEATGISRSGRVRKKSSKLTDFESPDEIDTRFKRRTDRPQKVITPKALSEDSDSFLDEEIIDVKDEPLEVEEWGEEPEEEEEGDEEEEEEEGVGGEEGGGDGDLQEYADPLQVDEDSTDVSRETSNYTQAQSLYFSEKQGKKSIVMKGGQVVVRRKKAQRKDKGKSRFTAYMLWAREVRPGIIQANPNMDFSAVNKRLGELWALVPTTQKYNWKRRAKRLAAKGNQKGGLISTGRPSRPPPPARANLINKGGVKPAPRPDPNPAPPPPTPATPGTGHHRHPGQKSQRLADLPSPAPYRVTGTHPIDVAAHIKLLGESLNNIGQKLKEHEGQIAVSGSLSVLLDSMLCVLGPLTCLADHVAHLKGSVSQSTLTQTLDNIAYIMPGIV